MLVVNIGRENGIEATNLVAQCYMCGVRPPVRLKALTLLQRLPLGV